MLRYTLHPIFSCCLFVLSCYSVHAAQSETSPPRVQPEPPPFVPTLHIHGAEQPVRLQKLAIRTDIQSGFAETTLDMVFFNPNSRVLEGELQFPLLPGQEISGLALDIQGEMRSAVPVPKARGQEIFEDVARKNVDPALLEATQGNAYKLRLYPIPNKGTRRVAVRILQPLSENNGMLTFRLPLAFAKHIDEFSVEALVAASEPPGVDSGSLGLVLKQAGLLYRGKVEKTDISPEGWLVVNVPAPATPDKGFNAVRWHDKVYFTTTASVETRTEKRILPKIVTLVWDASGSGDKRDHAKEYALLDAYFTAFQDGQARVIVVRNVAEAAKEFPIRQGDWSGLKSHLHSLAYDGGTDLGSWKPTDDCAEYLLFSDGLANFGDSRKKHVLPPLLSGQRLYAIMASLEADHNLLRRASKDRLVDLLRHDNQSAVRLLLEESTRVNLAANGLDLAGKGEVLLDPAAESATGSDRLRFRLAGWLKVQSKPGEEIVTLRLEHPNGKHESLPIALPFNETIPVHAEEEAPLPARLWGRYAMTELEANAHRHKAAMLRLGQELGIVSKETSLIVLETAEDYVRYDVSPPASLRAEVETLRSGDGARNNSPAYLQMEDLEVLWKEKVAWWEKDFHKRKPVKKDIRRDSHDIQDERTVDSGVLDYAPHAEYYSMAQQDASVRQALSPPSPLPAESLPPSAMADMAIEMDVMFAEEPSAQPVITSAQKETEKNTGNSIGIALQTWKSDAPYIERMNKAKKEDLYAIYLDERPSYSRSSAFFLDMADRFFVAEMPDLGLRMLSNLAEIDVENRQLLRMLAYRLLEAKEAALALGVLEKIRELAPYEPQSLRDLAGAHISLGEHEQAAELLYEVARRKWDDRFSDVNVIALTELNALIATAGTSIDTSLFDSRLLKNLPSDLRVVLTWDADNTDMDLWVTDPDGEKCSYENRLTRQGGAMSRDCTGGYGPEEFMLKKAKPGDYRVEVDYYGSSQQVLSGEITLYVALTTGFGTADQKEQVITLRLKEEKNRVLVGVFTVR